MRHEGNSGGWSRPRDGRASNALEPRRPRPVPGRRGLRGPVLALAVLAMSWGAAGCSGGRASPPFAADSTLAVLLAEIQPAVQRAAGLEARRPVNVARADDARVRAYLREQLERELPPERAGALTATYARLGLVPDTLDLASLFEALLAEQVIGYYDPESDTLFVQARLPEGAQLETVLAHELVHALQDQHVALDSLSTALRGQNDPTMAAQAAIEGHATFVMTEWQLGRMSGAAVDLTTLPDLGESLASLDLSALGDGTPTEVLQSTPAVIREGLLFPYIQGLAFIQRLWQAQEGRSPPFGSALPRSTEQVLHLARYLEGDAPTAVRFSEPPPDGWTEVWSDGLGEFETRIFLSEHLADPERAVAAAAGWDGDAYRLLRGPPGEALVWVSVWDAEAEADEFAEAAREAYRERYASGAGSSPGSDEMREVRVERATLGGRPGVVIQDAPPGVPARLLETLTRVEIREQ